MEDGALLSHTVLARRGTKLGQFPKRIETDRVRLSGSVLWSVSPMRRRCKPTRIASIEMHSPACGLGINSGPSRPTEKFCCGAAPGPLARTSQGSRTEGGRGPETTRRRDRKAAKTCRGARACGLLSDGARRGLRLIQEAGIRQRCCRNGIRLEVYDSANEWTIAHNTLIHAQSKRNNLLTA
jgi:hypothetical protein